MFETVIPANVRRRFVRSPLVRVALALFLLAAALVFAFAADLALTWWNRRAAIAALATTNPGETAYMRRFDAAPPRRAAWVRLEQIAPVATCAVLGAEDNRFFVHGTLAWDAQAQLFDRVLHGDFSAGSSGLAQQLARNLFLGPDRTIRRKAREYVLAYALSHALTKRRQLELYLNVVEMGPGVWGIGAASRHWFAKAPSELTPLEATLLAAILPAPRRGLRYAASARETHERVVLALRGGQVLDDVASRGTAARVLRWADHVGAGSDPAAARRLVDLEMGPEGATDRSGIGYATALRSGCNPQYSAQRDRARQLRNALGS